MLKLASLPGLLAVSLLATAASAADEGTMQHKPGFGDAVASPLEDVNLKRTEIPPVLKRAQADPYDLKDLKRCEAIAAEVGRLDAALGPDLDEAPAPDNRSRLQKTASAAHDAAVDVASSRIAHFNPIRGVIRWISGADRHAKAVQAAIKAGGVRRGYLKGVGMRMNCAPPAAPSWFTPTEEEHRLSAWDRFWAGVVAWFKSWWPF